MKLVLLMYLQEDEKCVNRLLGQMEIQAFSRLSIEGHGPGSTIGWSGEVQPYQSQLVMTILPDEGAKALMDAIAKCTGVEDPRHPIRAALLNVEEFSCCELSKPQEM
jgi:hypothetical protein